MRRPRLRIRTKTKWTIIAVAFASVIIVYLIGALSVSIPQKAKAGTETLSTGSFIIDMGQLPQTFSNGIRPYGMIYDLIVNYKVPVKWIIESTKVKDGTDFTYNATAYKGGPFILPAEYLTTAVKNRITYWLSQGVVGTYTTAPVSVPVYATLTNFPRSIIDDASNNSGIIVDYYDNAMIPSSGYTIGMAASLTGCSDLWVNPHGDPTWATHGYLYNLATTTKSFIWAECHAVSVMEGIVDPSPPSEQLNFLTTNGLKCYSNNKCGPVNENHAGNSSAPYTYFYPSDPVMQFMGTMSGACNGGSEKWYQPQSTGGWRPNTKLLVTTSDGAGSNQGILMAYGPAYGNFANGYVMYTGGHSINSNGTTTEKVAAQRAFFNYVLFAGVKKQMVFTDYSTPSTLNSQASFPVSAALTQGTPPYNYSWSNTVGGSFANPTNASTTFTAPYTNSPLTGTITCTVTDACGRVNFASNPVSIPASTLPITLKTFSGFYQNKKITLSWETASEEKNDFFEILRSVDGHEFSTVGTVKGSGNSTVDIAYNFVDKDLPQGYKTIYYQLKQYDIDGKSSQFDPIAVQLDEDRIGVYEVMPNPFMNNIRIDYYSENPEHVSVTIVNNTGKIIRTDTFDCQRGYTPIEMNDLGDLPAGIYFILLSDNKKQKLTRIIKL
jgi:hypothetical protein